MLEGNKDIDEFYSVFAGKFRRYHGESWLKRITDIKTLFLNIRDFVYFLLGAIQSVWLVRRIQPTVVLLKGGYVGVPIGIASAFWRHKIVTHDSDALPGLANRLVGRWATIHATAMPATYYRYDPNNIKHVGVLVSDKYELATRDSQNTCRAELNIPKDSLVLMVTGGSNGAGTINTAIAAIADRLLTKFPDLYIIHQVGIGKKDVYAGYSNTRLIIEELLKDMYKYSCSADLIITRAGANTLAEFGVQGKPCIVIPNPQLTGGHQSLNADYLRSEKAAEIVEENSLNEGQGSALYETIVKLLSDPKLRKKYAENINKVTKKNATSDLTDILLDLAGKNEN